MDGEARREAQRDKGRGTKGQERGWGSRGGGSPTS